MATVRTAVGLAVLLVAVCGVLFAASTVQASQLNPVAYTPLQRYPLFKQCNSSWGSDLMVNETICQVGCLMSSVSMALNGRGILVPTGSGLVDADPGTLNAWLRTHGGYVDDSNLNEDALPALSPGAVVWAGKYDASTSHEEIRQWLHAQRVVIANVMQGRHFVLVVDLHHAPGAELVVHDPGFDRDSYAWTDVVGWRIFDMKHIG